VGGMENRPGWGVDGDRSVGGTFVAYRRGWGKKWAVHPELAMA